MSGVPSLVDSAAVSGSKKRKTTPFTEQSVDPEVDNTRIQSVKAVIYPQLLMEEIPMTENGKRVTLWGRQAASDCLHGKDDRLVVVVGPCSIHDPNAAMDYASQTAVQPSRQRRDGNTMAKALSVLPAVCLCCSLSFVVDRLERSSCPGVFLPSCLPVLFSVLYPQAEPHSLHRCGAYRNGCMPQTGGVDVSFYSESISFGVFFYSFFSLPPRWKQSVCVWRQSGSRRT